MLKQSINKPKSRLTAADKKYILDHINDDKKYIENKNIYITFIASCMLALVATIDSDNTLGGVSLHVISIFMIMLTLLVNIYAITPSLSRKVVSNRYYRSIVANGLQDELKNTNLDMDIRANARVTLAKERLLRAQLLLVLVSIATLVASIDGVKSYVSISVGAIAAFVAINIVVGRALLRRFYDNTK